MRLSSILGSCYRVAGCKGQKCAVLHGGGVVILWCFVVDDGLPELGRGAMRLG
jgi:hypothetical protein